jgi:ribosomal RNA-processing protein 36
MDWPTDDDVQAANAKLQPSSLKAGFVKKRKQPDGGFDTIHSNNDSDQDGSDDDYLQGGGKKQKLKEVDATIRPSRYRMMNKSIRMVTSKVKTSVDPRFMDHAGKYDKKYVDKNYAFLDEMREQEIKVLKTAEKKSKSGDTKEELRRAIQSREEYLRGKQRGQEKDKLLAEYKQKQKQDAKQGIGPKHISEKQLKKQLGMAKDYLSLSQNQVDKRIKHKMESRTNRDKAEFRAQAGANPKRK